MEVSKLIKEIEEYITLYLPPKKQNNNGDKKAVDINNFGLGSIYISEASDSNGMLDAVLEHCDEDTLDELINTYGEESEICQYIRRERLYNGLIN